MSLPRLRDRIPSAKSQGVYLLTHHKLCFHKVSRDGSAKCDALETQVITDQIHGVLYHIDEDEKQLLDQIEGLGQGYKDKLVELTGGSGNSVQAIMYYATHINAGLRPYNWYKQHVLMGARQAQLPSAYVLDIEAVTSIEDPDIDRTLRELSIYPMENNNG